MSKTQFFLLRIRHDTLHALHNCIFGTNVILEQVNLNQNQIYKNKKQRVIIHDGSVPSKRRNVTGSYPIRMISAATRRVRFCICQKAKRFQMNQHESAACDQVGLCCVS